MKAIFAIALATLVLGAFSPANAQYMPAPGIAVGAEVGIGVVQPPRLHPYGRTEVIEEERVVTPPAFHPNIRGGGCPEGFGKAADGKCHHYDVTPATLDQYEVPVSQICGGKSHQRVRRPVGDGRIAVYDCP